MGGPAGGIGRGMAGRLHPSRARLADWAALAIVFSACATTGMPTAGPEGEAPREGGTQAAQTEGGKPAAAGPAAGQPAEGRLGVGLLSPLATIGYVPLKMLPCSFGILGSVVGFLFTFDGRMAQETLALNCGGDWIITPGMLEGREAFRPVGRIETLQAPSAPPSPPPTGVAPPIREPGTE